VECRTLAAVADLAGAIPEAPKGDALAPRILWSELSYPMIAMFLSKEQAAIVCLQLDDGAPATGEVLREAAILSS
jgi:hypothetical protein